MNSPFAVFLKPEPTLRNPFSPTLIFDPWPKKSIAIKSNFTRTLPDSTIEPSIKDSYAW